MDTEERSNFNNSLSDYQRLERVDKNDEETSFHLVQLASTSRPVIIIYPTIAPETVIIPIVVSIIVFPIFVVSAIFLLRYYNQRARAKDKFRSGMQSGAAAIFSLSKISATNKPSSNRRNQYRDGFLGMPELGLGTLMEEKEFSGGTSDETCQKSSISPNTTTVLNGIITNTEHCTVKNNNNQQHLHSSLIKQKNSHPPKKKRVTLNEDHILLEDDSNINNFESKSIPLKNFTQIVINGTSSNVVIASLEDLTTQKEDPDEIKVVSCAYSKKPVSVTKVKDLGTV